MPDPLHTFPADALWIPYQAEERVPSRRYQCGISRWAHALLQGRAGDLCAGLIQEQQVGIAKNDGSEETLIILARPVLLWNLSNQLVFLTRAIILAAIDVEDHTTGKTVTQYDASTIDDVRFAYRFWREGIK